MQRPIAHPTGLGPDLEISLELARDALRRLDRQLILATGATGFVGTWLTELLTWSADRLAIAPRLVLVSRDPSGFARRHPHLARHRCVQLITGDVRRQTTLPASADLVVAGASASVASGDAPTEAAMRAVAAANARLARDYAARGCRVLYLSSGAAGRERPDAYGEEKLAAEALLHDPQLDASAIVARLFTFVGPHLPLGLHFAVGNFLADALARRPVTVAGDGTAVRSYLYAADLARYLWVLAVDGAAGGSYDVGSPDAVTIAQLAEAVAALEDPPLPVRRAGTTMASSAGSVYLPDGALASGIGLVPRWDLESALRRTLAWHRGRGGSIPAGPAT